MHHAPTSTESPIRRRWNERLPWLAALLILLASALLPIATAEGEGAGLRSDAPTYGQRGPHAVGYRSITIGDGAGRLEADLWYPALNTEGAAEQIAYTFTLKSPDWGSQGISVVHGRALRDATVDGAAGPYPLIVFSHGFSGNPEWYSTLPEHYASHGFVVIAPEHVEGAWETSALAAIDRPRDIVTAIDHAERLAAPGGAFAGLIDLQNIAVVGHSYGGYTALASAGARIDYAAFNARCAALAADDPKGFLCFPLLGMEADLVARAELVAVPQGLWPSFGDPRVTAIVPMAGDAFLFDAAGLASVTVPMMAIGGTADSGTPYAWGSELSFDHVGSEQKVLVGLIGAEHMVVATPCEQMPWVAAFPFADLLCQDPVWDKARALDLAHHYSTAFLLAELKADADAAAALAPEIAALPGIDYRANGF
jgi:predicted dienelactone hydrolase